MRNEKNGLVYYTSDLLSKNGFTHGFFTRFGGVSEGDFDSLNISLARKDRSGNTDTCFKNRVSMYLRSAHGIVYTCTQNG